METKIKKIAVIGGGAAGMMAAIFAALERGVEEQAGKVSGAGHKRLEEKQGRLEVYLFEKNDHLGAKVLISGGGRCNLTTGLADVRKVLENYPRGGKFLTKAMYNFPPREVMHWFELQGVKLKVEDDLRVFPLSNDGHQVLGVLQRMLIAAGVRVETGANLKEIEKRDDAMRSAEDNLERPGPVFVLTFADGRAPEFDEVILATGGNAYHSTGSTGDGYAFAAKLGHTISRLEPSLCSFMLQEGFVMRLPGISFKKAVLTLKSFDGQRIYKRTGPFVFTHKGISGPVVFALGAMAAYEEFNPLKPMTLAINFFPDDKPENFKQRFDALIEANGKKFTTGLLDMLLPRSLAVLLADIAAIDGDLHVARLNREQRKKLFNLLVNFELHVNGRMSGDEFVTAGGVNLDEVDSSTMESKICPGLYLAGEILDVDGFTGGFNLQAAWATGRLAGESAGGWNKVNADR